MINKRATTLYRPVLLALCMLVAPSAQAASTVTWSGGTNNAWATSTNWNATPATGNILAFTSVTGNGGLNLNDNLTTGFSLAGITFSSTAAAFVITGNSFALTGGITDSAANAESIGDAITMSSVQTFSTASTLTLGGNISGNGGITTAGAGTLILGGTNSYTGATTVGTGTLTLNTTGVLGSGGGTAITVSGGTLNDNSTVATTGGITGTSSLTISSGTVTLNTANNYSGGTSISGGTLNIDNASALGSGSLTLTGGTIDNTSSGGAITASPSSVIITTDGTSFTFGGTNNLTLGGAVSLFGASGGSNSDQTTIILNGGTLTFTGAVTSSSNHGSQTLTVTGPGNLVFNSSFALNSRGSEPNIFNGTGNVTINGGVSEGGATDALTYSGSGTLTLNGASTYTGITTISSGTLEFGSEKALYNDTTASWTTSKVKLSSGATYAFKVLGTATTGAGLDFTSADIDTLKGLAVSGAIIGLDTTDGNFTYANNLGSSVTGLGLTKLGANTLTLTGSNTYTGTTTISAGTLEFGNEKALYNDTTASWTTSKVTVSSGATYAFKVLGTATTGAGLDFTSADIDTLKGLGVSGSFIGLDTTDGNFGYANNLGSSVTGLGLTKLGANTLTLTGTNTYTGATTVLGGVLAVNGSGSLASGSTVTVGGGAAGNAPTLTGTGTVSGNVIVASAGGGAAGTINPGAVGTVGTLKVGSITFQNGSTFAVDLGAGAANTDLLTITNTATISSGADISFNLLSTPNQGNYVLATAASGLNSASFTILGSVPSGYSLVATSTALDLTHNAALTITPAAANYNAHVGTSTTIGVTVGNSAPSGSASLTYNLTGAITGSNLGPVATGATASPTGSYSVPSTAGVNNLSVTGTDTTNGTDTATANLTVTGYNYANPTYTGTLSLDNVRVGASATKSVTDTTITNAAYQDSLDIVATNGGNALLTVGNPGNILAGASGNVTYTANAAGSLAATSSLGFTSDANGVAGLSNSALTAGSVAVTGAAYDFANAKYTGGTLSFGNVRTGASVASKTVAIGNQTVTNASFQDLLNVSATTGNASVTATGFNNLAASTSGATTNNLTVGVSTASAGSLASTESLTLVSNANGVSGLSNGTATVVGSPAAITTTGGVYDFANAKYTGGTLSFGNVRTGASVASKTVAIGNQTVTNASFQDLLNVSATTGNASVTATGFNNLGASTSGATTNNLTVGVSTATAGTLASTESLTLVSNANGVSGLSNGTATVVGSPAAIATTGGVYDYANPTYSVTLTLGNVRIGASATKTVTDTTITNAAYQDSLDVLATNGGNALLTVGNPGNILAGASGNVTYTANAAGSLATTSSLGFTSDANGVAGLSNTALTAGSVAVTGAAYNYASPTLNTVGPVALGNVRVGGTATGSVSISNTTITNASFQDSLDASATTNNGKVTGNGANITAGNSSSLTLTGNTASAGSLASTVTLGYVSNANAVSGLSNLTLASGSTTTTGGVYDYASPTFTSTLAFGNVRVGASATKSVTDTTITNASFQDSLDVVASNGGNTLLTVGNPGNITAGNSGNVIYTANAAGSLAATSSLGFTSDANGVAGLSNTALTAGSVAVTGAAYNYASPTVNTSGLIAFGNVHVGGTATGSVSISNTTISNASFQDSLDASATTNNGNVTGNGANITAGNSGTLTLTGNTASAGSLASTVTLGYISNANGISGLSNKSLTSGSITTTGQVYSGQGVWQTNIGGTSTSYGTLSNMGNWTTADGAPGLDSNYVATDSALFGNNNTGAGTVFLNGSNPSLTAITFNNTNGGSYTLAQGSSGLYKLNSGGNGASITDANGNDTISAPIQLNDNANVSVTHSGDTLTLSGILSELGGARNLAVSGAGKTVLTGGSANTYTGLTTVSGGELDLGKTAGVVAITGANAGNLASPDILVSGGELKFFANDQLANSIDNPLINGDTMKMTSGTIDLHGTKQTLYAFQSTGGSLITTGGRGSLKTTDPVYSAGTTDINAGLVAGGPTIQISGASTTVIVHGDEGTGLGGANFLVDGGSTGLEFTGGTLQLNSDASATVGTTPNSYYGAGNLMFGSAANFNGADGGTATVTVHAAATTATISSGLANANSGVVLLDGNNVTINTVGGAGSISTNSNGSDLNISAVVADGTTTGQPVPDGTAVAGSLTKTGAGILELSGANTYTGTTTISAGTLRVSGSTSSSSAVAVNAGVLNVTGTVGGTVNVASGATLSGTGSVGALTVTGGSIINLQDSSTNTLTGTSTLTLNSGVGNGVLSIDIGTGSTSDVLALTGAASLGSNLFTVNVDSLSGASTGTAYTFISASGGLTLADFTAGALTGTLAGDTITFSGGGTDVILTINAPGGTNYFYTGASSTDFATAGNYNTDATTGTPQTSGPSATSNVFVGTTTPTPSNLTPTLNANAEINSLSFTPTGAGASINSSGAYTLTIDGSTGITVQTGLATTNTETINANVALGHSQTWTVNNPTSGTSTLVANGAVSDGINGASSLTIAGAGTVKMANATGNSYSGGTTVGSGSDTPTLLISNTSNSATGSGALAVNAGATLAGKGLSSGSSFNVSGTGMTTSTVATVLVGHDSAADINTSSTMTLIGSGASTFANANLVFNLNTDVPGGLGTDPANSGNELLVGNTAILFGEGAQSVTLTLNLQGNSFIGANTPYVLVAGTAVGTDAATSQYSGLSFGTSTGSLSSGLFTPILNSGNGGSGNLVLSLSGGAAATYGDHSYLFLYQNSTTGVDDIEVEVVPEPSTWAMMLGGLAMLVFIQRRRRQHQPRLIPSRSTNLSTRHHENK